MQITDVTTHERLVTLTLTENDLRAILTKKLAEETGFDINPRTTLISFNLEGCAGQTSVKITMRNLMKPGTEKETQP